MLGVGVRKLFSSKGHRELWKVGAEHVLRTRTGDMDGHVYFYIAESSAAVFTEHPLRVHPGCTLALVQSQRQGPECCSPGTGEPQGDAVSPRLCLLLAQEPGMLGGSDFLRLQF